MNLADWYRSHGESQHLLAIERALTDEGQTTLEIAAAAERSANYTRAALRYLHEEHRAERRQTTLETPIYGQTWRWEWRRPQ